MTRRRLIIQNIEMKDENQTGNKLMLMFCWPYTFWYEMLSHQVAKMLMPVVPLWYSCPSFTQATTKDRFICLFRSVQKMVFVLHMPVEINGLLFFFHSGPPFWSPESTSGFLCLKGCWPLFVTVSLPSFCWPFFLAVSLPPFCWPFFLTVSLPSSLPFSFFSIHFSFFLFPLVCFSFFPFFIFLFSLFVFFFFFFNFFLLFLPPPLFFWSFFLFFTSSFFSFFFSPFPL